MPCTIIWMAARQSDMIPLACHWWPVWNYSDHVQCCAHDQSYDGVVWLVTPKDKFHSLINTVFCLFGSRPKPLDIPIRHTCNCLLLVLV